MALTRLISPEGDEVLTKENGVEALKDMGYTDAPEPKADSDTGPNLKKMKLAELLEHAESVGIDEETLAELHKSGTTKAQVIEAITAAEADAAEGDPDDDESGDSE